MITIATFGLIIFVAVIAMILFFLILSYIGKKRFSRTKEEVASTIENFINGTSGPYDWDDFVSIPIKDAELNKIRLHCANLYKEYPPQKDGHFCSEEGVKVLSNYIKKLREHKSVPGTPGTA